LTICAIAIGSNLGDRHAHLAFAAAELQKLLADFRFSSVIETEPVGVPDPQSPFLNAAAAGETDLEAGELMRALLAIEGQRGRVRPHPGAARTLDLDLILFGTLVIDEPGLAVPHPRFRERRFVLEPLAEIAPELRDPVTGDTVRELLDRLGGDFAHNS
jgi:2-amino-4-hydroxy-6-hydroxymethyldihydropteridine diphosphokinase